MEFVKKNKKLFLYGSIFGLIAPFVGLFLGLQVAPVLGNILMFPFILIGSIVDKPFGYFSGFERVLGWLLSIILWGLIFVVMGKIIKRK